VQNRKARPESEASSGRERRRRSRGVAMMELALLSPWVFFLFIGALDWGFYSYALVSLQAGARSAALYASTSHATIAEADTVCGIVLDEMRALPNIGTAATSCGSNPVVTSALVTGPDGAAAARVSVQYQTITMIPIPGVLRKQFTITRVVTMRLRNPTI
jgi:Flp pilus assembly protein TadG